MSDSYPPHRDRLSLWKEVVVPTARGLEAFFWRLVWFAVIVCVLASFNPFD